MISHIDMAHFFLKRHVKRGDVVIDATCGNGHDSALLADLALTQSAGALYCIDLQEKAIQSTKKRLAEHPHVHRMSFLTQSHTRLPEVDARAIIYNLGYLPGSSEQVTTTTASTLRSFETALQRLTPGGLLLITFYPGHPEGARELNAAEEWKSTLDTRNLKLFLYKNVFSNTSPQLWVVKKPFQKKPKKNI